MQKNGDLTVVLLPKAEASSAGGFTLPAGAETKRFSHEELVDGKIPLASSSVRIQFDGYCSLIVIQVDALFSLASASQHSPALLDEIVRVLKPGSRFTMREVVSKEKVSGSSQRIAKDLFTAFTLAGLVDSSLKLADANANLVEVTASKPKWEVGTSVSLKRPAAPSVWTVNAADGNDIEPAKPATLPVWASLASDDLVDENSLLNEEDLASLSKRPAKNDDCGTGCK